MKRFLTQCLLLFKNVFLFNSISMPNAFQERDGLWFLDFFLAYGLQDASG